MAPTISAISNLLSFENTENVGFFLYDGILDAYRILAYQYNWNENILSEISFGICNIIVSRDFNHHQQVLQHQYVWNDIVLHGI